MTDVRYLQDALTVCYMLDLQMRWTGKRYFAYICVKSRVVLMLALKNLLDSQMVVQGLTYHWYVGRQLLQQLRFVCQHDFWWMFCHLSQSKICCDVMLPGEPWCFSYNNGAFKDGNQTDPAIRSSLLPKAVNKISKSRPLLWYKGWIQWYAVRQ